MTAGYRPRATPAHGNDAGFTLIELIVALAILALLVSMLPGAFAVAQRAWDTVRRIERLDADQAARTFVEQRLVEALPVLVTDPSGAQQSGFRGEARGVTFVSPAASGPAGGGIYRYRLTAESSGGADALVLRQTPISAVALPASGGTSRILVDGLANLRFRYFGRTDEDQDRRWHDSWPDGDRLPELVEIADANETLERDRSPFRPLVVPLKLRRPD